MTVDEATALCVERDGQAFIFAATTAVKLSWPRVNQHTTPRVRIVAVTNMTAMLITVTAPC